MIIAFTRLHYGLDYLSYVMRSVLPYVDKYVILYTPVASFGRVPAIPCPDSRDDLYHMASEAAGDKLDWREGLTVSAKVAMDLYPEADIALELDADEVIHPHLFECILEQGAQGQLTQHCYRLPFWHHWRSFRYACEDGSWPARLYLPKIEKTGDPVFLDNATGRVHHFGYARKTSDMVYKWEASAHLSDFRPEWWDRIWNKFPDRLMDLHPVSVDYWNAKQIARDILPTVMWEHTYRDMDVIE
jgi:hypothetical protein